MEKLLTVIVPVYNTELYLRECIDSIIDQTYTNFDIILVDDGSIDTSGTICDEYAQRYGQIKVIHQSNQGPNQARWAGLQATNTKYVTFVDSDDYIKPFTYEKCYTYILDNIDMVEFGRVDFWDDETQIKFKEPIRPGRYNHKDIKDTIYPTLLWDFSKNMLGMAAVLWMRIYKTKLIKKYLSKVKDIYISYLEDALVFYPLFKEITSYVLLEKYCYMYRQRPKTQLPPYYKDINFFKKLFIIYEYLSRYFGSDPILNKQLEYFYMDKVCYRKKIYVDSPTSIKKDQLFPFDRVGKGENIILYAAGDVGITYYDQVTNLNYCNLVLWVDKLPRTVRGIFVQPIDAIKTVEYDKIVIAVVSQQMRQNIVRDLVKRGVDRNKIID